MSTVEYKMGYRIEVVEWSMPLDEDGLGGIIVAVKGKHTRIDIGTDVEIGFIKRLDMAIGQVAESDRKMELNELISNS